MKKIYFFLAWFLVIGYGTDSFAQAVLINDNYSLDGLVFNGRIILGSDRDNTLWSSDGTAAGTVRLSTELKTDSEGSAIFNNKIYFAGTTSAAGNELWSTDGTAPGTTLVSDVWAGPNSSEPADFVVFNNKLYFTAITPEFGRELYEYSGSGTPTRVTDLNPGALNSFENMSAYVLGSRLYFNASNTSGNALYVMEGSSIKQLFLMPAGFFLDNFSSIGNTLFFGIRNGMSQSAVYKSDGTPAGTTMLTQFSGMFSGMFPLLLINIQNKIYFLGTTDELGTEPYITDGNTTELLKDINPDEGSSVPLFAMSVILNGKIIFAAETDDEGMELWSTDGTPAGTTMLKDINPTEEMGSNPLLMPVLTGSTEDFGSMFDRTKNFNGFIFFIADDGRGNELWKTDGTADGTVMVKQLNANPLQDGVDHYSYIYTQSGLIFAGDDGSGFEPWISDGTAEGTRRLVDINPSGGSDPDFSLIWNGDLYFTADNGNGGIEEYRDFYKLTGPFAPLPVVLIDFTAKAGTDNVQLHWNTSTESNSDKFIILRSSNGEDFNEIASVPAAGSSSSARNYSYIDNNAFQQNSDKLFYRLKMVDKDGKASLSKIVSVVMPASSSFLSVFPNPARENLRAAYSTKTESVLTVSDLSGKVLYRTTLPAALKESVNIDVSTYPKGTYVIRLVEGSIIKTEKFIKK